MNRSGIFWVIWLLFLARLLAQTPGEIDKMVPHGDLSKWRYSERNTQHTQPYDVTFYHLKLDIRPDSRTISGSLQMTAIAPPAGLQQVAVDLFDNMTVDEVRLAGSPVAFSRDVDVLLIDLPQSLSGGQAFSLEIDYHGSPERIGFGSFNWSEYNGTPRIWTLSEPYGAPAWWPCKDDPADKADSVFVDITVPDNLVALSNGLLTGTTTHSGQRKTFYWQTRYPISPYLVVIAVGDYQHFSDEYVSAAGSTMPLDYYAYPELLSNAHTDLPITKEMISFFSGLFGEYPFIKEKYGTAIVADGASMEHQTLTTLRARHITGQRTADGLIAHELAHHWFGDLITLKSWTDIWLHEGFASYCEALWFEYAGGHDAYIATLRSVDPGNFAGTIVVTDTINIPVMFSPTVYRKGAWVLHMLRGVIGDALFFEALQAFATDPRWKFGNATTLDFVNTCEQISGRDLRWFFEQWLFRPGRPVYDYNWNVSGTQPPYQTTLNIDQSTSQPYENNLLYKMPLQVRLLNAEQTMTVTIWDSLPTQQFTFETDFRPTELEIDPDDWVLKRLLFNGGNISSIPQRFTLFQNYPNPFNGTTTIRYGILRRTAVTVEFFNVLGEQVLRREIPPQVVGFYDFVWDGKNAAGENLPSGVYYYRFSDGTGSDVRKLLLVR